MPETGRPIARLDAWPPPSGLSPEQEAFARRVAQLVAEAAASDRNSPWLDMKQAIVYSRIPEGTFRKWAASGRIPSHGGKRRLFYIPELDRALLGYADAA
jgi:hypothetical protein